MNAIVHADYASKERPSVWLCLTTDRDRESRLLPFGLTIEDVLQGVSRLRNRAIGAFFHELRPIEQWGSGIQRMSRLPAGWPGGSQTGRNRDAFPRDHFQHAVRQPIRRDEPAHPRFGSRWSGAVDSGRAKHAGLSQRATLTRLKSMTAPAFWSKSARVRTTPSASMFWPERTG